MFSDCSIQPWLNFNYNQLQAVLPCHIVTFQEASPLDAKSMTRASCEDTCTDSTQIFQSETDNLLTCGLWSTIASHYYAAPTARNDLSQADDSGIALYNERLGPFDDVGLDSDSLRILSNVAEAIASCFASLYLFSRYPSVADDGNVAVECTQDILFSPPVDSFGWEVSAIAGCLGKICSPRTLNPDIAGVGVFSSLVMQIGIALGAIMGLLMLELWPSFEEKTRRHHTAALITALVEFHKNQCYFVGAIQIAIIAAHQQAEGLDTIFVSVLAINGLVSIISTLVCITRYGRQSWYMILLSLVMFLLSTATLALSFSVRARGICLGRD